MHDGEGSDSEDEAGEPRGASQNAEQPAADSAAEHPGTDKGGKPPAVITVLADCTEEGPPQKTQAITQGPPQQPAVAPSSAPAAEAMGASQRPAAPASDSAADEAPSPLQVLQLSECAMTAQQLPQLPQDRVRQGAVPEDWATAAQPTGHGWSAGAEHAQQAGHAAEALPSPKRHRQPSSKAAEAPGSPGRPMSPAQRAPGLRKRMARSRRVRKEGTYIGSGIWLMCYCAKHQHALEQMGASRYASSALPSPVALSLATYELCKPATWHACCAVLAPGTVPKIASYLCLRWVSSLIDSKVNAT